MNVQVFGVKKSADTRKALRFFSERGVKPHFVDFKERGPSKGELTRFVQKLGVDGVLDQDSRWYRELGLHVGNYSPDAMMQKMLDQPLVVKMPLVRCGNNVTAGLNEVEWKSWFD